nr:hypothetical protein BaRGS_016316 [Batillaria attramentaria]
MVKNFVLAGGSYLGICAGAYFACDRVHFDQYGKEEVCDARDLKLFPGMGIGPVIPVSHTHVIPNSSTITISLPHTTISSTPALLTTSDHTLVTYINRGGNFSLYPQSTIIKRFPHVKDLQTIATYPSLPNSPVAVVKVEVAGGGMVVLSFPHLEFCAFELRKADFEQQTDLRELQEADQRREALLKAVLEWTGDWRDGCAAVILGGGYDLGFIKALGHSGVKVLRDFVLDGGTYIGFCAGGYFGCDSIEFDKGGKLEVWKCIGPVVEGFKYDTDKGLDALSIKFHATESTGNAKEYSFQTYVNGGGMH